MDSIQAENNTRARTNQQFESSVLLAEHEFTPKIRTLVRQSAFTRKQLTDLISHITETQGSLIQNIKNSYESSKLQLEQQIKQDSISKMNPIVEDQRLQASKIQKLTENIVAFLSKNADSIREVQNNYDSVDRDVTEFNKKSLSTVNEIQPRISVDESKISYLENQTEEFMHSISQIQDMKNAEKELRDTLRKIEDEDVDAAVNQAAQETLALISSKTTEIDQRIFETETLSTSLQGSLESGKQSQEHQDAQVEEMSRKSMEIDSLLKTDEDEITGKLVALQNQLTQIKTKIMDQIKQQNDSTVDGMKFSEEDFQEQVQRLSTLSSKDISDLADDWNKFTENNKTAQETADKIIYDAMNKLEGSGNVMKRISYQEARLKWCLQRIEYWEREDAKKKRSGFQNGEEMAKKVDELEQKIRDFEASLEDADGQKAKIDDIEDIPKSVPIPDLSEITDSYGEVEELKVDPNLVLTYPDDEPPFEPLKRTKEDEEMANKRLEKLKQEKEKRFAIKIDDSQIVEDFVDQEIKQASEQTTERDTEKEEKPKKRKRKSARAKAIKDEQEEEDENEEETKPKISLKAVVDDNLNKDKNKDEEEDQEGKKNEEEDVDEKAKPKLSLKAVVDDNLNKDDEDEQNEEEEKKEQKPKKRRRKSARKSSRSNKDEEKDDEESKPKKEEEDQKEKNAEEEDKDDKPNLIKDALTKSTGEKSGRKKRRRKSARKSKKEDDENEEDEE